MKNASLALVITQDNRVLLVQRKDVPVWVLPGGGIEESESPEVAAVRETFEESGVRAEIIDHVATYLPMNSLARTTHVFLCRPIGPLQTTIQSQEVASAQFFPLHELPVSLFSLHRTFISEWQSAPAIPIVRTLTEVSCSAVVRFFFTHPLLLMRYLWTRFRRAP